eukprot:CAMPEP_0168741802 /NCGR_PEP_ID=MMETSP0724-20121128/12709_1 /TAXON_ID=265536 /ORGANISM="Amphiprora sp., Strain CCMP467" /LENGTH=213 /DNA_ID=CAMNT_0008789333 /DNA_START=79 /DNA_END=723 /DNA_ORIENTATION=+
MSAAAAEPKEEEDVPNMSLLDITEGDNERGIPKAKFIDDVGAFSTSFQPPASPELLIGAYSDLMNKYRTYEAQLNQRQLRLQEKVPELEKSLSLLRTLMEKQQNPDSEPGVARYSLADNIFAQAELDYPGNQTVNLWLGANVMLEFTYQEALDFLSQNQNRAKTELDETKIDLAFVRDQIVTSEVTMSRIFNWDVRRKRNSKQPGASTNAVST